MSRTLRSSRTSELSVSLPYKIARLAKKNQSIEHKTLLTRSVSQEMELQVKESRSRNSPSHSESIADEDVMEQVIDNSVNTRRQTINNPVKESEDVQAEASGSSNADEDDALSQPSMKEFPPTSIARHLRRLSSRVFESSSPPNPTSEPQEIRITPTNGNKGKQKAAARSPSPEQDPIIMDNNEPISGESDNPSAQKPFFQDEDESQETEIAKGSWAAFKDIDLRDDSSRPSSARKTKKTSRFNETQEDAQQIKFSTQEEWESRISPKPNKRKRLPMKLIESEIEDDFVDPSDEARESNSRKMKSRQNLPTSPLWRQSPSPSPALPSPSSDQQDQNDRDIERIEQLNAGARRREIRNNRREEENRRRRVIRREWSNDESKLILRLVGVYGTQWSLMEKLHGTNGTESKVLTGRNQVAIKDRARTLKKQYLSSGMELPEGFDMVTCTR
ncbi:Telomeric DNA-binding factor trf1 [Neolecta irregularis DAH-3]|uniref:Telomeric DNA-binding factor trf1 n=1 Tax=Neolecta irregularis (strain DAH-3) TaxID=1198029 RepID=A0A1U7LPW5_NEOID|nr:Telomeric DNA-binding factor trf1 [Neolecta irregularis DAH-3]|eukprot:OLL24668.1 Telomeric DNA-binding factor trf1 [Neolecta irregularis DAH-3]